MVRALCVASVLFLLAGCGGTSPDWNGRDVTGVLPDLRFELTEESERDVTASRYEGKPALVFFGWTNCPDVCPGTLRSIDKAIQSLPDGQQDEVNVLFISVDPERDTPRQLRSYTDGFGPQFIGLTGSQSQLSSLTKRLRATYGYGDSDEEGNYEVSHSMAIYGFDADGQARVMLESNRPTEDIAEDIERLLSLS
ncbi:SCO family protein [Aidingimonas lacisalsi]|uniref:SCO family protein n=1 Tax=Aidingimonas lacisalsi TaxID=2604086 RepID=UPI0011D1BC63|nr:SCO family protein [Aidingimonas lacisalsi]